MVGIRAAQKRATRDRVVEAARRLFEDVGYEPTTIRMIADKAGVAVGSVFTTFESKVDIFNHILMDKAETLFEELGRISPHLKGSARERLGTVIGIAYSVECRQLELMISHLSASHGWPRHIETESKARQARLTALFRGILEAGQAAGEVTADADLDTFCEVLTAVYLHNYRRAFYEQLNAAALTALAGRQLAVMFAGIAPRAA